MQWLISIIKNPRFYLGMLSVVLTIGAFYVNYKWGYKTADAKCQIMFLEAQRSWESEVKDIETRLDKLYFDYNEQLRINTELASQRTQKVIKYVEKDPDSNTVILDSDIMRVLNESLQGGRVNSKNK